jgi:hypothetical protein
MTNLEPSHNLTKYSEIAKDRGKKIHINDPERKLRNELIYAISHNPREYIMYPYIRDRMTYSQYMQLFTHFCNSELIPENSPNNSNNPETLLQPLQLNSNIIIHEFFNLENTKYNSLIDYYQERLRARCRRQCGISPWAAYNNHSHNYRWICRNLDAIVNKTMTPELLANELRLVYKRDCDALSPSCTLWILNKWCPEKVLFFCGGWGGSIVAAAAYNNISINKLKLVTAIDANLQVVENWKIMINDLDKDGNYDLHHNAFEDVELLDKIGTYDFAFACPPYFTSEIYSDDTEQSSHRYGTGLKEWLDGFLKPVILKAWKSLRVNGVLAIMINDTWQLDSKTSEYIPARIVQSVHNFIKTFGNSSYDGIYAFRPDSIKLSYQPLFVWTKTE